MAPAGAAPERPPRPRSQTDHASDGEPARYVSSARDSLLMYVSEGAPGLPAVPAKPIKKQESSTFEYDEFAIGWNEIFDQDPGDGWVQSSASAVSQPSRRSRRGAPAVAAAGPTGVAFWTSEVLTSKKPPAYLRVGGGKSSAIDKGMKDHLLEVNVRELRKPAEVMERELDQLRDRVAAEQRERRREARQQRRLQRKCRVKENESLDELEERYETSERLRLPLPELAEPPCSARTPRQATQVSKDFFARLGRRQLGAGGGLAAGASAGNKSGQLSARWPPKPGGSSGAPSAQSALSPDPPYTAR